MNIAIIGAGAVGGVAAAALIGRGHDVTLCVRRPFSRLIVDRDGMLSEFPANTRTIPPRYSPVDWILLATKAQDSAGAAPWLDALAGPNSTVAVLQNGIDHVERITPLLRHGQVLPAVVYSPGDTTAPGYIRTQGRPRYVVPAGRPGAAFAALFDGSAVAIEQSEDFVTAAWRKFLANISANPITALTLSPMRILNNPRVRPLAEGMLAEAMAVGRAMGAALDDADIATLLGSYVARDPDGGTSMYFDRLAGRPMEHEYLTGALVRAAERLGIAVPLNGAILALLRGLQASPSKPVSDHAPRLPSTGCAPRRHP